MAIKTIEYAFALVILALWFGLVGAVLTAVFNYYG